MNCDVFLRELTYGKGEHQYALHFSENSFTIKIPPKAKFAHLYSLFLYIALKWRIKSITIIILRYKKNKLQ